MVKVHSLTASACRTDIVRAWTWTDGTQCVLAVVGSILELRIETERAVLRRASYMDVRQAVDAAQRWRVEYEIDCESADLMDEEDRCVVCRDTAMVEVDPETGIRWLRCPSCGNVWIARNC